LFWAGKLKAAITPCCKAHCAKGHLAMLMARRRKNIEKQITGSVAIETRRSDRARRGNASHSARRGDVVLLAPACASSISFRKTTKHRGPRLQRVVHQLERQAASYNFWKGVRERADDWKMTAGSWRDAGAVSLRCRDDLSASAVTADSSYGHSTYFSVRQAACYHRTIGECSL